MIKIFILNMNGHKRINFDISEKDQLIKTQSNFNVKMNIK